MSGPRLGVLALQGDFEAHLAALRRAGSEGVDVRYADQIETLDGLIIPGGESTTLLHLIEGGGFAEPLRRFHARGGAILGTCAGMILIARRVCSPEQPSLGFIDIDVERNGYGRQRESFETAEAAPAFGDRPLEMVFIRAPRIRRVGEGVEVLASRGGEPVMARQGRVLAAAFHPEMTSDDRVHRHFAGLAGDGG